MPPDELVRRRVIISGRVQGVFFRDTTRRRARELGLHGWVGNRADGRVEAVFQGPRAAVDAIVEWCHHGPPHARVTAVEVVAEEPAEPLTGFSVRDLP